MTYKLYKRQSYYADINPLILSNSELNMQFDIACEVCGWQIHTNVEEYYQGHKSSRKIRTHKHCFGRQNRSRPYRPSATPRQGK